jgi:hypothetical protein
MMDAEEQILQRSGLAKLVDWRAEVLRRVCMIRRV